MSTQSSNDEFNDTRRVNTNTGLRLKSNRRQPSKSKTSGLRNEVFDLDNEVSDLGNEVMELKYKLSEVKKESRIMFDTLIQLWNIVQDLLGDFFNLSNRVKMFDARSEESKKWFKPTLFAIAVYLVFFWWVIKRVSIFILNK
jgi:hypothetical protein